MKVHNTGKTDMPADVLQWQGKDAQGADMDADRVDGPSRVAAGTEVQTKVLFTTDGGIHVVKVRFLAFGGQASEVTVPTYALPA